MLRAKDPLRDHLTIFWHGTFCSSVKDVGSSSEMIEQSPLPARQRAGSFETLARGIGKTPAMLRVPRQRREQ
jgi:uncharacterized protein (DUF1800 family)